MVSEEAWSYITAGITIIDANLPLIIYAPYVSFPYGLIPASVGLLGEYIGFRVLVKGLSMVELRIEQ